MKPKYEGRLEVYDDDDGRSFLLTVWNTHQTVVLTAEGEDAEVILRAFGRLP